MNRIALVKGGQLPNLTYLYLLLVSNRSTLHLHITHTYIFVG